ncbi:Glutathione S-transferase Mu 3 [Tyrophagus putrescentiae]|nr:Glutathione S-transferase Mu 3 [Tyrophagus putrescentiae]
MSTSKRPVLGYWNQRGLAQPIRLALTYLNVDFEDKRYSRGDDGKGSEWFSGEKLSNPLGLDFPNSIAILRYIGFKYDFDGKTTEEKNRINLVEREIADLMFEFYQLTQRPNYDELSYDYFEILEKVKLKNIEKFLGERLFLSGGEPSYVDFLVYEWLIKIKVFAPKVWEKFETTLGAYVDRIENLPRIKEYIAVNEPLIFSGSKILLEP